MAEQRSSRRENNNHDKQIRALSKSRRLISVEALRVFFQLPGDISANLSIRIHRLLSPQMKSTLLGLLVTPTSANILYFDKSSYR